MKSTQDKTIASQENKSYVLTKLAHFPPLTYQ
jgi:hypothetical protein